ncbi:ATP-dependent DNA helicase DinG [Mangrovihabitans endophyticus]|uniref:DNA 5'-3' helicase n=2 Tax=Mangrovihabitans endophyticus TaxID=1751298 RepID=A0A8J3BW72_9ACTN|nr:ATP-dependent DNA helicase DinG [Mangrovihabitans endophyticus]
MSAVARSAAATTTPSAGAPSEAAPAAGKGARRRPGRADASDLLAAAVQAVPGGATRPGQEAMAAAIEKAVTDREHLLVQAGTGTGKSLAYLTPALLVDGPVVVSTATLALQNQLVEHDLPRLAQAVEPVLGRRPTFAVLKGRHHYLCMAKMEHADEEAPTDSLFDDAPPRWLGEAGRLGKQIQRLQAWADKTATGDRDELDPGVDDTAWRQVSMPARDCVGAGRCPYGNECFAEASRVRAREADIVVTNHSLLAVDMIAERAIVPPHKLLVIDEAHELADRVSSAAQAELTPEAVERAAKRARPLLSPAVAESLSEAADALTVGLGDTPAGRLTSGMPPGLAQGVLLLDKATRAALQGVGEIKADDPDPVRKQQAKATLDELSDTAQRLMEESDHDVAWVEKSDLGHGRRALVVAPLSVAGTLANRLYQDRTVVATSATLALGGRFDTVARSLGLPVSAVAPTQPTSAQSGPSQPARGEGWSSLDVGSPFDYGKQGILYVAAHLPRPAASGLPGGAGEELLELIGALGGRTLGLFSSRRAATQAAELVRARTDLPVLLQGEETLPLLVRKFREDRASCLFGVMSLWQGVDVPGDACQLVVIDRLPFPRPDEPLAAARSAAVDAAGGSGFASVSVPIAAVRLAQGVGRLIRSTGDKGVVAVLDSRLETARGYGAFLRKSLPPFWYTCRREVAVGALRRLAVS